MSKLSEAKNTIDVKVDMDELDVTSAESKATYVEIKDYVFKTHGLKVSNLYISQVKRKREDGWDEDEEGEDDWEE